MSLDLFLAIVWLVVCLPFEFVVFRKKSMERLRKRPWRTVGWEMFSTAIGLVGSYRLLADPESSLATWVRVGVWGFLALFAIAAAFYLIGAVAMTAILFKMSPPESRGLARFVEFVFCFFLVLAYPILKSERVKKAVEKIDSDAAPDAATAIK